MTPEQIERSTRITEGCIKVVEAMKDGDWKRGLEARMELMKVGFFLSHVKLDPEIRCKPVEGLSDAP